MKFVATKKGMTTNFIFTPLFCCYFWIRDPRSGIRDQDWENQDPVSAKLINKLSYWPTFLTSHGNCMTILESRYTGPVKLFKIERHCNTCMYGTLQCIMKDYQVYNKWRFLPVEQCWFPAVLPGSTCSQQTGDIFPFRCHNPGSPPEI